MRVAFPAAKMKLCIAFFIGIVFGGALLGFQAPVFAAGDKETAATVLKLVKLWLQDHARDPSLQKASIELISLLRHAEQQGIFHSPLTVSSFARTARVPNQMPAAATEDVFDGYRANIGYGQGENAPSLKIEINSRENSSSFSIAAHLAHPVEVFEKSASSFHIILTSSHKPKVSRLELQIAEKRAVYGLADSNPAPWIRNVPPRRSCKQSILN